ncbi:hypothetical protein FE782_00675 [Paenibacillus antri]|uniref:Uncharacterized protein n=1 Tax=Paenibacillus antri TaxID=2582848 RepID=A0A5R9GP00_9BACL|nr:hypothetical protein [Paenibacillus antri]TLS53905.1 hypothetical protein FE782_00675 [Paenibacillus antri]
MVVRTVYASSVATLDSNVFTGGGTNVTRQLQEVLDRAKSDGGVHLVMDGVALVSGLVVHSNTTIECLTKDCGFFLDDQSNCSIVINADRDKKSIKTRCISLLGGTYNHNAKNQLHHVPTDQRDLVFGSPGDLEYVDGRMVMALEFYGVEYLTIKDITIRDQRSWAAVICNWRHVVVENVHIDLQEHMPGQNQDGLHFWGPGRFLTIKNLSGRTGDDILALAPDELDRESDITDVEVDGVYMDDADQGIRLLSRAKGRLDRVTIRNVYGTYKSFGFYINPWFSDGYGSFGNILIENVDLRQSEPNYHYTNPFLFRIGGNIECLTLKNIRHHYPSDDRPIAEIGIPFVDKKKNIEKAHGQHMNTIIIDGLTILEEGSATANAEYIKVVGAVDNLVLKNVMAVRKNDAPCGKIVSFDEQTGSAENFLIDGVYCKGYEIFADTRGKAPHTNILNAICDGEPLK